MKGLKLLLSLMMVFALRGCQKKTESKEVETVTLTVTIVDETTNTELYSGTLSASGSELTLEDVLLANEDEIKLVSERSSHGMQIIGLIPSFFRKIQYNGNCRYQFFLIVELTTIARIVVPHNSKWHIFIDG